MKNFGKLEWIKKRYESVVGKIESQRDECSVHQYNTTHTSQKKCTSYSPSKIMASVTDEQIKNPQRSSDITHCCHLGVPNIWTELLLAYIVQATETTNEFVPCESIIHVSIVQCQPLEKLKAKGMNVRFINIIQHTQARKNAHPTVHRRLWRPLTDEQIKNPQRSSDITHCCHPGVPNIWTELLLAYIVQATETTNE
ncbi:PC-Esterase [Artemisia annua]|uniref:PC-Esterase n=1 Tax=Artemisia annua TaxID=35608 RepID=A0A2U1PMF7_ARTAN|nr:PC-Esterase [Artemisia annua]